MIQTYLVNKKACLFSILSLFATMYSYSDLNDVSFFNPSISISANIALGIFFLLLFYFFYKHVINKISKFSTHSKLIGIVAGIINVLGRNFVLHNSMQFFCKDVFLAVNISLLAAMGYGLIYASVFELGWNYLESQGKNGLTTETDSSFLTTLNYFIFDKHPLLYPFLFICLFWAPYLISFFPGTLQSDAIIALLSYYGIAEWSNVHPVIGTLLMGYIMDIGKYLGNDNYGCAIYVILQFIFLSVTLAYNFVFFQKWKTHYLFRWVVLFFFSLHPVFPTFAMTEVKDVFYYIAYLWLLFLFIRCFEEYNKKIVFYIVIASMFVCALRKEGIILCIVCSVILFFYQEIIYKKWKKIFNSIMIGSTFAFLLSYAALVNYNVAPTSVTVALTIPLQQMARYIRDYSEDITEIEWEILNSVSQNKANELGNYYEPELSDAVREQLNYFITKEQLASCFNVWFNCFLRHPGCYFSAAFNQMYGYFYIGKEAMYKIGDCRTENFVKGDNLYHEKVIVVDNPKTISFRKPMIKYIYSWASVPLLGLLYHPALYTWILFFGFSFLIHFKKYKYLFLYCMPFVILGICCLSPANAYIRYSYPIIMSCFLLLAYNIRCWHQEYYSDIKNDGKNNRCVTGVL